MEIKFKKLDPRAVAPVRATEGSAGWDITAVSITTEINECGQLILVYHTGLAVELPDGYEMELRPRSSICKKSIRILNAPCTIDSDYRGEITIKFMSTTDVVPAVYKEGERIAQALIHKVEDTTFVEVEELTETARGEGGYGSTGSAKIVEQGKVSAPTDTQSLPENEDASINSEPAPEVAAGDTSAPEQA